MGCVGILQQRQHCTICAKWPIRPADEIYNAKPPKSPEVRDIHNAKLPARHFRTAESSSARGVVAPSAFWGPANLDDASHAG